MQKKKRLNQRKNKNKTNRKRIKNKTQERRTKNKNEIFLKKIRKHKKSELKNANYKRIKPDLEPKL